MSYQREVQGLSAQAKSVWGKSDYGAGELWLPLYLHMVDSGEAAIGFRPLNGERHSRLLTSFIVVGTQHVNKLERS